MNILVIGDVGHPRASCVHWMGSWPNVEEFDLVIIAQNTLTQKIFDQIKIDKCRELRPQIDTIFNTGRSIWCILEKSLRPTPRKGGVKAFFGMYPSDSYEWFFVKPEINEVREGTTVQIVDKEFTPYLREVRKWGLEIEDIYARTLGGIEPLSAAGMMVEPIACNKSKKMIGARVININRELNGSGSICFLPKPTKCDTHEAIEILLDIATGDKPIEPAWRNRVEVPGLNDVESRMSKLKRKFDKEMAKLETQQQALDTYRNVFSTNEEPQVNAVQQILSDLGIETQRTQQGFQIDLIGKEVAVEVTSVTGKIDSNSPKMFQLTQFIEKQRKSQKVILIANTYKREHPSERKGKQDFTQPVIDFLKLREVCALTSITLMELWKLRKSNRRKPTELLLHTIGELKLSR